MFNSNKVIQYVKNLTTVKPIGSQTQMIIVWGGLIINLLFLIEDYLEYLEGQISLGSVFTEFVLLLPLVYSIFYTVYWFSTQVVYALNQRIPWDYKTLWKRVFWESLWIILFAFLIAIPSAWFILNYVHPDNVNSENFFHVYVIIFITMTFVFGSIEFMLLLENKNKYALLAEKLEKENIVSQYDALKNQINPHFMFNCLNVLSTLIYKDVQKADQFIAEFSKVFRYVLELNTEPVVQVKQEVEFLQSYIFLQKIRFGQNLQVDIELTSNVLAQYIPPLSLEILIENAIKHNEVSQQNPLKISLKNEGNFLIVENNYQPRNEDIVSTGVGHHNLKKKYEILSDKAPYFSLQNSTYICKIPLIQEEAYV